MGNAAHFLHLSLLEWAEGLSAQLGCKQKGEAVCVCIQFPSSYSFTFLITFLLNLLLKTLQKILFVSFLGKPIKIFWLLFWYSFLNHKHSKPSSELKPGCWKSPLPGILQTELLLNQVARNYLLLTVCRKHENNTHVSHFRYQILLH